MSESPGLSHNAKTKSGRVREIFYFDFDRTYDARRTVAVIADVDVGLTPLVDPSLIDLGTFGRWKKTSWTVRVINRRASALVLEDVSIDHESARLDVRSANDGSYIIHGYMVDDRQVGLFASTQRVVTNHGTVEIVVKGDCQEGTWYLGSNILSLQMDESSRLVGPLIVRHIEGFDVNELSLSSAEGKLSIANQSDLGPTATLLHLHFAPNPSAVVEKRIRVEVADHEGRTRDIFALVAQR